MTSDVAAEERGSKQASEDAFAIAAALLRSDLLILPWLLLALGLPSAAQVFLLDLPEWFFVSAVVMERFLQLAVLFAVTRRWKHRLEQPGSRGGKVGKAFLRTLLFGTVLWLLCVAPLVASTLQPQSSLILVASFLFVFGLVWSLRHYFYFVPTAMLGLDLRDSAVKSLDLTKVTPRAALRSALAPAGITLLLVNLCSVPYPDGRSVLWSSLGAFSQSTFWLLSTYSALAFSLTMLDDADWRAAGLDPYRAERLQTLKVQGRGKLADLFTARTGVQAIVLAVLIFISNSLRDFNEAPAASFSIKRVEYGDNSVTVFVQVSDPQYALRGFLPVMFSVATRDGTQFSRQPPTIKGEAEREGQVPRVEGLTTEISLNLQFLTNRSAESLKTQADLWLWYKGTPVAALPNAESSAERGATTTTGSARAPAAP